MLEWRNCNFFTILNFAVVTKKDQQILKISNSCAIISGFLSVQSLRKKTVSAHVSLLLLATFFYSKQLIDEISDIQTFANDERVRGNFPWAQKNYWKFIKTFYFFEETLILSKFWMCQPNLVCLYHCCVEHRFSPENIIAGNNQFVSFFSENPELTKATSRRGNLITIPKVNNMWLWPDYIQNRFSSRCIGPLRICALKPSDEL